MAACVVGAVMIGMAFMASKLGSVLQAGMTIAGGMSGPVFGIFILGIAFPRVGKAGAWTGLIIATVSNVSFSYNIYTLTF